MRDQEPPVRRLGGKLLAFMALAFATVEAEVVNSFHGLAQAHRLDLAEVCCTKDSPLATAVERAGGSATRYSVWNGFDLSLAPHWNGLGHSFEVGAGTAELEMALPLHGHDSPWS